VKYMEKVAAVLVVVGASMMAGGIGTDNSGVTIAGVVLLAVGILVGRLWSR